jgi:hypothetical protein
MNIVLVCSWCFGAWPQQIMSALGLNQIFFGYFILLMSVLGDLKILLVMSWCFGA